MNRFPLVTVITPTYNRADLLGETIESVLGQDYPHLEYIVLDDGSTDETEAVLRRYEGRLRWQKHPNSGEARTVNKGFALARGQIIGVVNSDDPLLPGAITRIVQCLMGHPHAIVAYPDWQMIDRDSNIIQEIRSRDFVSHAHMVAGHHCIPGPGAFFFRGVVTATGGRDPEFRQVGDMDFWFRAGFLGDFVRVPEVLANFRVHGDSMSVCGRSIDVAREHVRVVEKFFNTSHLPEHFSSIKQEAFLNAYHAAVCFSGKNLFFKCRSMLRSFLCCPITFLLRYKYRVIIYLLLLFGIDYSRIHVGGSILKISFCGKR